VPWAALALMAFYAYGMAFIWGHYRFLDLRVYMGAAHELLDGRDPYGSYFTFVKLYATYPPFALAVFSPLSMLPMHLLVYLWSLANLACLGWLCKTALAPWVALDRARPAGLQGLVLPALLALACTIALQPVRADLAFGQVNLFLIAVVVRDLMDRRGRWRGLLVGIAGAIKFTPLVFVLLLAVERDWKAVRRSVAAFAAATAVVWALAPSASDQYFLHFATTEQRIGPPSYVSNQSLNGIFTRLGLGGFSSVGTWFICSVAVVALALFVARRLVAHGGSSLPALLVVATAGLLASPISWDHHWSWVALFPFAALDRRLPRLVKVGLWTVVIVAVAAPYWWHGTTTSYGIPTGPLGPLADDSLALAGLAFLGSWAWVLRGELVGQEPLRVDPLQVPTNYGLPLAPARPGGTAPSSRRFASAQGLPSAHDARHDDRYDESPTQDGQGAAQRQGPREDWLWSGQNSVR
jgi:alpha-1,2-mannosyltransferase